MPRLIIEDTKNQVNSPSMVDSFSTNRINLTPDQQDAIPTPKENPLTQQLQSDEYKQNRNYVADAFKYENTVGSTIDLLSQPSFDKQDGYDAVRDDRDLLRGMTDHFDKLTKSQSHEETVWRVSRIYDEQKAKENIASNGAAGFASMIAAGLIDPINAIPIVGQSTKIKMASTALTIAAEEAYLHNNQQTRTVQESALNIGTGAIMTGALAHLANRWGGNASAKHLSESLTEMHDQPDLIHITDSVPVDAGAAATIHPFTSVDNQLVGGPITEALTLGAGSKMLTSELNSARQLANETVEHSFVLRGHEKGLYYKPLESQMKAESNQLLGTAINTFEKEYKLAADDLGLTRNEFNNMVTAQMRNDLRPLQNVPQQVVRAADSFRNLLDTLGQRLHHSGFLPNPDNVRGAMYYVPRLYDRNKVMLNAKQFQTHIGNELEQQWLRMTPEAQQEILDHIGANDLHTASKDVAIDIYRSIADNAEDFRSMNERKVTLDDDTLSEWLINDPSLLATRYAEKYLPKVSMYEKFGAKSFDEWFMPVRDEAERLMLANPDQADKWFKELKAQERAGKSIYNRMLNIREPVSNQAFADGMNSVQKMTSMTSLGAVTLTSLTDAARQITINGPLKAAKYGIEQLLFNSDLDKLSKEEMKLLVAPLEDILNTRVHQLSDIMEDYSPKNPVFNGVDWLHNKFMRATGLPQWTTMQKIIAGNIVSDKIVTIGKKLSSGKSLTKGERIDMAQVGLNEDILKRIAGEYNTHGQDKLLNINNWTDEAAADALRQALPRYVDKTINTVNKGELPVFMDSRLSRFFMQFQSFAMTAWNQTLIAGLQKKDANFYMSVVASMAIAGVVTKLKNQISGAKDPEDWKGWSTAMVDRSGIVSLPFDMYNRFGAFVGLPTVGSMVDHAMDPTTKTGQTRGPDWMRALGPGARTASNIYQAMVEPTFTKQAYDQQNISAARRLIPFQNLFYASNVFDQVEKGVAAVVGVPYKPKDTAFENLLGN